MSIKRQVTITCDGWCGTTVVQGTVPDDWLYLKLFSPHIGMTDDSANVNLIAYLCPKCSTSVRNVLEHTMHVAFNTPEKVSKP